MKFAWDDLPDKAGETSTASTSWDSLPAKPSPRNIASEVGSQLWAGASIDLPKMIGQSIQWMAGDQPVAQYGKELVDWAKQREKDNPDLAPQVEGRGIVGQALSTGARALAPSMAAGLPAVAAAPLGATAAMATGIATTAGLFGSSQAQDTYEKVLEASGDKDEATKAGWINGLIEAGGEGIGSWAGLKLLGVGGRVANKVFGKAADEGVQGVFKAATDTAILKPFLVQLPKTAAIEASTEFGQNAGEAAVEQAYGVKADQTPMQAGVEGGIAALGMTALLTPFGLAGFAARAKRNQKVVGALQDGNAPLADRVAAAKILFEDLKAENKDAADAWAQNSAIAITGKMPIVVDESFTSPTFFGDQLTKDAKNVPLGLPAPTYNMPDGMPTDPDAVRASEAAQARAAEIRAARDAEEQRTQEAFRKLGLARTPEEAIAAAQEGLTDPPGVTGLIARAMERENEVAARDQADAPAVAELQNQQQRDAAFSAIERDREIARLIHEGLARDKAEQQVDAQRRQILLDARNQQADALIAQSQAVATATGVDATGSPMQAAFAGAADNGAPVGDMSDAQLLVVAKASSSPARRQAAQDELAFRKDQAVQTPATGQAAPAASAQPEQPVRYQVDEKGVIRKYQGPDIPGLFDTHEAARAGRIRQLKAARRPNPGKDSLNEWISARGGVAMTERADTIGEGNKAYKGGQWLFRREGQPMDLLAESAHTDGFLTDEEYADGGGVEALRRKIGEEYTGQRQHFAMSNANRESEEADAREERDIMAAADQAGIPTDGLTLDQIKDAVVAYQEKEALKVEAEAVEEARLEREAIQADNLAPEENDDFNFDDIPGFDEKPGAGQGAERTAGSDQIAGQQPVSQDAPVVVEDQGQDAQIDRSAGAQRQDQGGVDGKDRRSPEADGVRSDGVEKSERPGGALAPDDDNRTSVRPSSNESNRGTASDDPVQQGAGSGKLQPGVVPGGMFLNVGGVAYPVDSFKAASDMVHAAHLEATRRNNGSQQRIGYPTITDANGKVIAHIGIGQKVIKGDPVHGIPNSADVLYDPTPEALQADLDRQRTVATVDKATERKALPDKSAEDRPALDLAQQTPAELSAQAAMQAAQAASEAAQAVKQMADDLRTSFQLTGSNREADVAAAAGQGGLFDRSEQTENKNAESRRAPTPFDPKTTEFIVGKTPWRITVDRFWKIPVLEKDGPDKLTWKAERGTVVTQRNGSFTTWADVRGDDIPSTVAKKASDFYNNVVEAEKGGLFDQSAKRATNKPAPLYASRSVVNADDIIAWAKEQGFQSTLPAEDMHVTVAYSKTPMVGSKVPSAVKTVDVDGGERTVEPLGDEGAVVLKFSSPELQSRWKQYRDAGASWDYESYTPHITLTYNGAGVDLSNVIPYAGPINLGPESQEPLNEDKADEYEEQPTQSTENDASIQDFGEKIGGARKDTAQPIGKRSDQSTDESNDPGWRKRYTVYQIAKSNREYEVGRWAIADERTNSWRGQMVGGKTFATEQEANDAVPLLAVAQKHRVVVVSDGNSGQAFEIWRDVTDRKRVKVVDQQFATREDAMRYMAENAVDIIQKKTNFGEEILAKPDTVTRTGVERRTGPATTQMFTDAFGFRAVEFGKWNNQDERQEVMNHAYDGLLDLADVLNIPAKAISLNGELALAFGARGQGLSGARAHYETDYGVINLTKMTGAGALAHEWFHAADHYFARQDTKASSEKEKNTRGDMVYPKQSILHKMASHGFRASGSQVRPEVRAAYENVIRTMFKKAEKYVEDTEKAEKFVGQARNRLAEALQEIRDKGYYALSKTVDASYGPRKKAPATSEQLARFDALAEQLIAGQNLEIEVRSTAKPGTPASARGGMAFRRTNDTLEALNEIIKEVRGRNGFKTDGKGELDGVRYLMGAYAERIKMLESARSGDEKTKGVPTSYAMESKKIDQGRASDYWMTEHEMAARAFSAYVEDKIAEQGNKSDFLSYGSNNNQIEYKMLKLRPFPEGAERVAINEAFDKLFQTLDTRETDRGVAMYQDPAQYSLNFDAIYDNAETRPGTTDEQRAEGVAALKALFYRDRRAGATLLGSGLWKGFVERQGAELVGQTVEGHEDLAMLAQILRDPRFETLRFFFTKGNDVVGHTATTSRMPGSVAFSSSLTKNADSAFDSRVKSLRDMMKNLDADGYWMLHNHPGGTPDASRNDLVLTNRLANRLEGFRGHVIIDHDKYGFISNNRQEQASVLPIKSGDRAIPELPNPAIGSSIENPVQLVSVGKNIQARSGFVSIISTSAAGRVNAIAEMPESLLLSGNKLQNLRAIARIRRFTRMTGGQHKFAFVVASDPKRFDHLLQAGVVRDAIDPNIGQSRSEAGVQDISQGSTRYPGGALEARQEGEGAFDTPQDAMRLANELDGFTPSNVDPSSMPSVQQGIDITLTRTAFRNELTNAFGQKATDALLDRQTLVLLDDQSQLPAHVVPFVRSGDTVFGFYDPKTDKTYAVLGNMTKDMVRSLVMHEVGVHYGMADMLGADKYNAVMKRLDVMRRSGNKAVIAAFDRATKESADASQIAEETLAYLVMENPEIGIVREIFAAIKAFLFKTFGIGGNSLTAEDLAALAKASVLRVSRGDGPRSGSGARFSREQSSPDGVSELSSVWDRFQGDDEYMTDRDLADEVENIVENIGLPDADALEEAVRNYRQALKDDFEEFAGRNDMDAESELLQDAISQYLGKHAQGGDNVRFARQGAGNRASWDAGEPSKLDNFIRVMQDKHIDTKRVLEAIKATSGQMADAANVYLQEELYHGRTAKQTQDFLDDELRPLVAEMAARGIKTTEQVEDFEQFLHARHAEERNAQIAKVNPDMPDGGSGLTNQEARDILAKLPADRRKAYDALAKRVDAINAATRQALVTGGLESADTVKAWESVYRHYVPLQREDMEGGLGTGQGFSVRGSQKRATGSRRKVVDILANIAMQRERAIVRSEKNRVANALVGLVESQPNADFWKVDQPPILRRVDERTGLVVDYIDPLYKSRDNVVMARAIGPDGSIVERAVVFNEFDERAMRMAHALKNLDLDDLGQVLGAAAKATRYFAAINTQYNPVFGVVNLFRDTQGALFNLSTTAIAGKQKEVLQNTLSALRGIYIDAREVRSGNHPTSAWAQLFEEFQREGGQTGYRDMFATSKDRAEAIVDELKKTQEGKPMKAARAVFDWLSDYNDAMENAVRLAAYKVAKDNGISSQQAASIAKNLTVNFNRKGTAATQAGALYAFFNASVQGTARLAETLAGPMGRKIVVGGLLLGGIQALALAAAGFGDDEPPDFVRERSLILPIGDKKYLTMPMPLGLHVIPNISRILTEWSLSGFKSTGKRATELVGVFAEAFNPIGSAGVSLQTLSPTVIDPFVALAENRDWTGKPIAREDLNKLAPTPGHTRAKDTASWFAKATSKGLNYLSGGTDFKPGAVTPTPDQIDYLIGQVTGGVGRELMKVEQGASSIATGEDLPPHKIPLLGRFYGNAEGQSGQSSQFYDNLRSMNEHEAEIKGRRKAGQPLGDYMRDNPEAVLYNVANRVERQVSELRKRKRALVERGDAQPQVHAIDDQITAVMRNFNGQMARYKDQQ